MTSSQVDEISPAVKRHCVTLCDSHSCMPQLLSLKLGHFQPCYVLHVAGAGGGVWSSFPVLFHSLSLPFLLTITATAPPVPQHRLQLPLLLLPPRGARGARPLG